jgi:diaminopimelate epimerase
MQGTIPFFKMVAAGNDFIVIDNRKQLVKDAVVFARDICQQHTGIGGDGVLLVEPSKSADFLMRIINADGSEAEACGNGFRCAGLFAHKKLGFSKQMRVETLSGEITIDVKPNVIRVKMVNPKDYREQVELTRLSKMGPSRAALGCAYINTGVPHVVVFTEGLKEFPVSHLGHAIRYHDAFQPAGTNVDFVEVRDNQRLAVRTYERGVEGETLACGTGVTAAAIVGHLTKRVTAPVQVETKSGEVLTVDLKNSGTHVENVFLEGNAQFVFEGRI